MQILHGFWRISQALCLAVFCALFSINSFADCDVGDTSNAILIPDGNLDLPSFVYDYTGEGYPNAATYPYSAYLRKEGIVTYTNSTTVKPAAGKMAEYNAGQTWSVQFETGTISGYASCAGNSSKTSYTYPWGSAFSGCICSINNTDWYFAKKVGTSSGWEAQITECYQKCAHTCAEYVRDNTSSMRTKLFGSVEEECPLVASNPPQPTTYTITYDADGGTGCTNESYTDSATICTPTKPGYRFEAWYDMNSDNTYTGGESISGQNLELLADWTFIGCDAGFYYEDNTCKSCASNAGSDYTSNGGTNATSINACYKTWTCPELTCPGHSENCAYIGGTSGTDYYGNETEHCGTTFDCANGYQKDGINPLADKSASESGNGYIGWRNDSRGALGVDTGSTTTYGLTQDQTWATEFDYGAIRGNASCSNSSSTYLAANALSTTDVGTNCYCQMKDLKNGDNIQNMPTTSQWVYYGSTDSESDCAYYCAWYCAVDMGDELEFRTKMFNSVPNNNPSCSVVEYSIVFNTNNGVFPVGAVVPENYTIETGTITLPTPVRDGYTFNGWYDNSSFNGNSITQIPTGSYGDKEYWADWTLVGCNDGFYYEDNTCKSCETGFTSDGANATSEYDCYKTETISCTTQNPYTFGHGVPIYTNSSAQCITHQTNIDECDLIDSTACDIVSLSCDEYYEESSVGYYMMNNINKYDHDYGCSYDRNPGECPYNLEPGYSKGFFSEEASISSATGHFICSSVAGNPSSFQSRIDTSFVYDENDTGIYCWAKAIAIDDQAVDAPWFFKQEYDSTEDCLSRCGQANTGEELRIVLNTFALSVTNKMCVPITHTITYDNNGGDGCYDRTHNIEDRATICVPSRDGHTFDGWIETTTTDIYMGGETAPLDDLTLEAQWTQCDTGFEVIDNVCTCNDPNVLEGGVCHEDCGLYGEFYYWDNTNNSCTLDEELECENNSGTWDGTTCQYCSTWNPMCNTCEDGCPYGFDETTCGCTTEEENDCLVAGGTWDGASCVYTVTYISYCDSDFETDLDINEISTSDLIIFPSDLSSCLKNNSGLYEYDTWTCVNASDETQTTTLNGQETWNAEFYNAYCYPNWTKKPTVTAEFYCDEHLAAGIDINEFLVSDGITFPSDLSSCPQIDSYNLNGWVCENANDSTETVEFANVANAEWTTNFYEASCYPKWVEQSTTSWDCVDGEVDNNSDNYYPRGALDSVQEINSNTYYEFDGDSYQLLTGSSNSYNLSHALTAKNSGDTGSYAYQQYLAELDYYTSDQGWSVTFGNTTISGVSVCAARGWGTYLAENANSGSSLKGVLTGTFVGCACSLDKERWIGAGQLSTTTNAWESNNTFCRTNCPAACAYAVATDKSFRDTLFNGVCPIPSSIEPITECDDGELLYDNTCVVSCDDRFEYNGVCYATCPGNTFAKDGQCVASCGDDLMGINGVCEEAKFMVETTSDTRYFEFTISAAGTFYIDWGDGNVETRTITSPSATAISHSYNTADSYLIKLSGLTTAYSTANITPAVGFGNIDGQSNTSDKVAGIYGSLGAIFPTIGAGDTWATQPRFYRTFHQCGNLASSIPVDLFKGIDGTPVKYMFFATFMECPLLSGTIPPHLFNGISGKPNAYTFDGTFSKCSSLTGIIPPTLFENIYGELDGSEDFLFAGTFWSCSGLTGTIPENLFSGISGAPTKEMFDSTFLGCSGLTGTLPQHLFDTIRGPLAQDSFSRTFMQPEETAGMGVSGCVPIDFFKYITNDNNISDGMTDIFTNSGITEQAPAGWYKVDVPLDEYWSGHIACAACEAGKTSNIGATSADQCYVESYECYSGEYLNVEDTPFCDTCPEDHYCPHGTWTIDTADESKHECPSAYKHSNEGSYDEYSCYANVTYVFNDGDEEVTNKVYYTNLKPNYYTTDLPQPERDGYVLEGWYTDENFADGTKVDNGHRFTDDVVLYAKWVKAEFECESGMLLHLDNKESLCLSDTKVSPKSLVFDIDGNRYYLQITDDTTVPVHENSNIKMHIYYNGHEYNVHDASIN